MGNVVSEKKYQFCICGKTCKGRAALANHGKKCPVEQVRSAAFFAAIEKRVPALSDRAVLNNLLPLAEAMVKQGKLDAGVLEEIKSGPWLKIFDGMKGKNSDGKTSERSTDQ